jgi:hypothetical protein
MMRYSEEICRVTYHASNRHFGSIGDRHIQSDCCCSDSRNRRAAIRPWAPTIIRGTDCFKFHSHEGYRRVEEVTVSRLLNYDVLRHVRAAVCGSVYRHGYRSGGALGLNRRTGNDACRSLCGSDGFGNGLSSRHFWPSDGRG